MDCSTPGFPVIHYLLEFAQTHVHWISDANQPSYPLSPPSPPALTLSLHDALPIFCNPTDCNMPGFPVLHYLSGFTQTHVHWISDAIQPSHPLVSPLFPPSIFPSIRVFQMSWLFTSGGHSIGASALTCPSNEYPGLISFRIDWFDLFAVQGTVKSLL